MYVILDTIIKAFRDNMNLIVASSMADNMVILAFSNLVNQLANISSIYISNDITDFKAVYRDSLRLYSSFASMYKAKDKFGYNQVYDDFEELLAKSLNNGKLRTTTIEEYINFTKCVHRSISNNGYSSRSFDNVIWLPIILGDEQLYDGILKVVDDELDEVKIDVLIKDLEREIYSMSRRFSSHSFRTFESLKKYEPDKLDVLKHKLMEIKEDKKKLSKIATSNYAIAF